MQNNSQDITTETIKKIVDVARLAPSVHNTQAWKVKIGPSSCQVIIDKRYALSDGDPTGRQAVIGIGIFCEALVAALLVLITTDIYCLSWFCLRRPGRDGPF